MAKIAILCSNLSNLGETDHKTGVSLLELAPIVYELERAEHRVEILSPLGGVIPIDPNTIDLSHNIVRDYYERKTFLHRLEASLPLAQLDSQYVALVVCGGWGCIPEFTADHTLGEVIVGANVPLMAFLAHGTSLLMQPSLKNAFHGFKVTAPAPKEDHDVGFKKFWPLIVSEELHRSGYELTFAKPWSRHIMDSGRLITAQNVFSAQALGEALVRRLNAGET